MEQFIRGLGLLVATLVVCSCQTIPDIHYKVNVEKQAPTSRDSAALAYDLSRKTWCSNDDAFSMILLLVDSEDRYLNFDDRRVALDVKGLADIDWNLQADEPITKGTMGFMACRALGIKGGLMMQLIPCRRYAYREALYHGLMKSGSENEPLTGPEAVGILSRLARFQSESP